MNTTAFVTYGPWGADSRKHPALRFIEAIGEFFESIPGPDEFAQNMNQAQSGGTFSDWYTDDFTALTPHGEQLDMQSYYDGVNKFYWERFTKFRHVPYHSIAIDASHGGYNVIIMWSLYANLKRGSVQENVTDEQGDEWDLRIPLVYNVDLVKVPGAPHEGLQQQHLQMIKDTGMVDEALRGDQKTKFLKRHKKHEDHHGIIP